MRVNYLFTFHIIRIKKPQLTWLVAFIIKAYFIVWLILYS